MTRRRRKKTGTTQRRFGLRSFLAGAVVLAGGAAAADVVGRQRERDHEQAHSADGNKIVRAALDVDLADDVAENAVLCKLTIRTRKNACFLAI